MKRIFTATLLCLVVLHAGCGKTQPPAPPAEQPKVETPAVPEVVPVYELDPAKQLIPSKPVEGTLAGKKFQPTRVYLDGTQLTWIQGDPQNPTTRLTININQVWPTNEKLRLQVRPDAKPTMSPLPNISSILDGKYQKHEAFALTLELEPVADHKVKGRIHLSFAGDAKEFIAGTIDAIWNREVMTPPGESDRPYITGLLTHNAKPNQTVAVGYVKLDSPADARIYDSVFATVSPGMPGAQREHKNLPATATVRSDNDGKNVYYDFSKLPTGKYLIAAHIEEADNRYPPTWKVVDVSANTDTNIPIVLGTPATGEVEVELAGENNSTVYLLPSEIVGTDMNTGCNIEASFTLGTWSTMKDGKATLKQIPAGECVVFIRKLDELYVVKVKVEAGKTIKATPVKVVLP